MFKAGIDKMIDNLKASEKSDVSAEIYMPGELEYLKMEDYLKYGISMSEGLLNQLKETQQKLKLATKVEDLMI